MQIQLNAVEVLYLHYVGGRTKEDAVKHSFWFENYGVSAKELLQSLLYKEVIYLDASLEFTLTKLKIKDLKTILKSHDYKVSGNKNDLIARIIKNETDIDWSNIKLKGIFLLNSGYNSLISDTKFIDYFHSSSKLSIYEGYDYYLSNPGKSSDEVVIDVLNHKIRQEINKTQKYNVKIYYKMLSDYYLTHLNDWGNSLYNLNNFVMLIVLDQIYSYRGFVAMKGLDQARLSEQSFNVDVFSYDRYKGFIDSNKISSYDLYNSLLKDSYHISDRKDYKEVAAQYISNYVLGDKDADFKIRKFIEDVLRKENQNDHQTENEDVIEESRKKKKGFLKFLNF